MANSADSSYSNLKELAVSHSQTRQENGQHLPDSSSSEVPARGPPVPNLSRLLRGKGREWEAIKAKPRPLQLLDLPVDILRLIVKEVSWAHLDPTGLTDSANSCTSGHPYERPNIVGFDELYTLLSYNTSHLCSV